MLELDHVQLNEGEDLVKWKLEKSGAYTTKSMLKDFNSKQLKKLWKNKMPMKLKVFIWLAFQDKLQTGMALKKRKWKGYSRCILCGVKENVDHIFFGCAIYSCVWSCFK